MGNSARIKTGGAKTKKKLVHTIVFCKSDGSIIEFEKFNPYHDQLGRFSTANSFTMFSPGSNPMQAKRSIDRENARRKKEGVEGEVGGKFVNVGTNGKNGYSAMPYNQAKRLAAENAKQVESKQPKSNFKPAATKKEAIEYAKKELGFQKVSYGTKLDIDTINHINEQISSIQAKYPEVKGSVQELKTTTAKNVYAQIRTKSDGTMNFEIGSAQYGKGLAAMEASYKRDVERGFHPSGTSANSIVWHEYGHVLGSLSTRNRMNVSAEAMTNDRATRLDFINRRRSNDVESEWVRTAAKNMNIGPRDLGKSISRYATKNYGETFAEAFAEVNCSDVPRRGAIEVVKAGGYYRN